MKPFLRTLIIITGLYVIADILFDLNFNPEIYLLTKIIKALFFLLLLIYVVLLRPDQKINK
ncbi:UNVERIFIED_ORG: hypothetical protein ABRZ91_002854 [Heyndrickxia coagulans]